MPWTEITRAEYQRSGLRYASDMTDAEWALIARRLPPRRRLGRPREVDLRTVLQAILYILSTGCQWRALPKEFPPYSTVQRYFYAWRDTGRWQKIVTAPGSASPPGTRTQASANGSGDRQSERTDDPSWRPAWLRRRQTYLRTQAAHRHRHQWPPARRPRSSRQRSGFSWGRSAAGAATTPVPQAASRLCRSDLPRKSARYRALPLRAVDDRDRRTAAGRQRLPAPATAMGGRTHLRLVLQMPPPCQGFEGSASHRSQLGSSSPISGF